MTGRYSSPEQLIEIVINAIDDPPVANDDAATVAKGAAVITVTCWATTSMSTTR